MGWTVGVLASVSWQCCFSMLGLVFCDTTGDAGIHRSVYGAAVELNRVRARKIQTGERKPFGLQSGQQSRVNLT